jgi:hypothetical protein
MAPAKTGAALALRAGRSGIEVVNPTRPNKREAGDPSHGLEKIAPYENRSNFMRVKSDSLTDARAVDRRSSSSAPRLKSSVDSPS